MPSGQAAAAQKALKACRRISHMNAVGDRAAIDPKRGVEQRGAQQAQLLLGGKKGNALRARRAFRVIERGSVSKVMSTKATITLCADDYGLTYGVSRGIIEALRAGRLSAVSALVTGPRWPALGHELMRGGFDADVGLHLNLTLGEPLGPMPQFAKDGVFPPIRALVRAAREGKLPLAEIRAEISRQLDRFEAVTGRPPDFVDGHQHVQVLPHIRDELLDELAQRGLKGRLWLRDSGDALARILARGAQLKKALIVSHLARDFAREAELSGFKVNRGFSGFSDFHPGKDYARLFKSYLRARGPRHLIMCHPGHVDAELRELEPVTVTREQELAFLLSPGFEGMLAKKGLKLGRLVAPAP